MQEKTYSQYPFLRTKELYCSLNTLAQSICISEKCTNFNPLICLVESCLCQHQHQQCEKITLQELYTKIQSRRICMDANLQEKIQEVQQSFDTLSDLISQSRLKFQDSIDYFGLGIQTINFIKNMREEETKINLSKELSYQIIKQISNTESMIPPYAYQLRQLKLNLHDQIEELIEKYNCLYFQKQQLDEKLMAELQKIQLIDSKPIIDLSGIFKCSIKQWLKTGKKIRQVQMISIYTKDVTDIVPALINFSRLQVLTLSNCNLKKIPGELKQLRFLIELDLGNNQEIQIIQNIQHCCYLKRVMLNSNRIRKIQNLDNLKQLFLLDLSYNKITKIQNVQLLKKLKKLFLFHNPINQDQEQLKLLKNNGLQMYILDQEVPYS